MRPVNRPTPAAGPEMFKTYTIAAPMRTHYRRATCEEVGCPNHTNGWKTVLSPTQHDMVQAVRRSGRRFFEEHGDGLITFTFPPGQPCFQVSQHRIPLEREPLYLVRGGDFRGNPRGTRAVRRTADEWVDDFATHQQKIHDAHERG